MIEELKEGSLNRWMCKFCFRNFLCSRRRDDEDGIPSFARMERWKLKGKSGKTVCLICR